MCSVTGKLILQRTEKNFKNRLTEKIRSDSPGGGSRVYCEEDL